jgi:hypothetical protein
MFPAAVFGTWLNITHFDVSMGCNPTDLQFYADELGSKIRLLQYACSPQTIDCILTLH